MTGLKDRVAESVKLIEVAAERKLQLAKLDAAEKIAITGGGVLAAVLVIVLSNVLMLTLNLGLAFGLAEWTSLSVAGSFFLLSSFYVLMILLIIWQRERFFVNPILAVVIRKFFK